MFLIINVLYTSETVCLQVPKSIALTIVYDVCGLRLSHRATCFSVRVKGELKGQRSKEGVRLHPAGTPLNLKQALPGEFPRCVIITQSTIWYSNE